MPLTTTTLAAAISTTTERQISVASATGITVDELLRIDEELVLVTGITGTWISVMRGIGGTKARTHLSGTTVTIGLPSELLLPVIQYIGKSLTGTAGATATKGYLTILVDGTLRYIPLTDSV